MKPMIYKPNREIETLDKGTYKGYDYIILSLGTHPCAYVRVPKTHKYFKQDYDDIDVDCNGGLTYADESVRNADKKGWWIGWDYAHLGDFSGYDLRNNYPSNPNDWRWTTEEILAEVKRVIQQLQEAN